MDYWWDLFRFILDPALVLQNQSISWCCLKLKPQRKQVLSDTHAASKHRLAKESVMAWFQNTCRIFFPENRKQLKWETDRTHNRAKFLFHCEPWQRSHLQNVEIIFFQVSSLKQSHTHTYTLIERSKSLLLKSMISGNSVLVQLFRLGIPLVISFKGGNTWYINERVK